MSIFNRIQKSILSRLASTSWEKKAIWMASDYSNDVSYKSGVISFALLALSLNKHKLEFLLDGYTHAKALQKHCNAIFEVKEDENRLLISIGNIKYWVETSEELYILNEIFVEGCYNVKTSKQNSLVVVDIGMNVAYTTIWFANRSDIARVYSFEPFLTTFEQAKKNIALNPLIAEKIAAFNYGLGAAESSLDVSYDPNIKGQMGIFGVERLKKNTHEMKLETIYIKSISAQLSKIIQENPNCPLLLKVDCEGAEYGIFEALDKTDLLKHCKIIVMEWHNNGAGKLLNTLSNHGFASYSNNPGNDAVGMIYAFNEELNLGN